MNGEQVVTTLKNTAKPVTICGSGFHMNNVAKKIDMNFQKFKSYHEIRNKILELSKTAVKMEYGCASIEESDKAYREMIKKQVSDWSSLVKIEIELTETEEAAQGVLESKLAENQEKTGVKFSLFHRTPLIRRKDEPGATRACALSIRTPAFHKQRYRSRRTA